MGFPFGVLSYFINSMGLILLLNISSCARQTVWPNTPKCWSLGQRKVCCKGHAGRTGGLCLKDLNSLDCFQGRVFIGKFWGEGCKVCDFLLIDWW